MKELGKWITNQTAAPFYARKMFQVKQEVKSATARVCGLGQFVFYINGEKVGDHELDPGWTDYKKWVEYVTFDVTSQLKQGGNVLGLEVGNGWFHKVDEHYTFAFPEFMPPNPNPYEAYGKSLMLALELELVYVDGTREIVTGDDTFQVKEHPIIMSNVYGSETVDGSISAGKNWCNTDFDASDWQQATVLEETEAPKGKLVEQFQPAIKVIHTYEGELLHTVNAREIYDFGQNMSGILEFEVKGKKGDKVCLYPAEKLAENGDVDQVAKGWVTVDSCITYIIGEDDVWETYRMKFTYFAGRFMAVEKIPAGKENKVSQENGAESQDSVQGIQIRNLKGHAISSAHKTDGSFTCDDKRYEQIYELVEKAVEANMVSVHTDCPTIERFAWQEPNHLMAPSIFYMKDGSKLWEKFLMDMRMAQHTAEDYFLDFAGNKFYPGDGLMPSQCPCYIPNVLPVPGMGSFYDIIPWGSTCILGTYWHYTFYGDIAIIQDNYDAGLRYWKHLKTKVNENGFLNHGLGDWGNPRNELVRENVETAFLYADTMVLASFAKILGKPEDQAMLEAYGEEVKKNYNEKLLIYHPEKGFWCYRGWDHPEEIFLTQAAEALPLYWGLVPEEKEADIVKAFRYTMEKEGALISGEVGLPYVIQTARKYGMNDLISQFILREQHPSYYAFVLDGETTLGEYWETNPRSHCHDMMGHIIEWYYNGIAGICPEEPGFAKVSIAPYLPETMHEFACTYETKYGEIRVHVKEEAEKLVLEVKVPEEITYGVDTKNLEAKQKQVEVIE